MAIRIKAHRKDPDPPRRASLPAIHARRNGKISFRDHEGLSHTIDREHLALITSTFIQEHDDWRQGWIAKANAMWDIWNNLQDWSAKEDWQSRLFIPKGFNVIEQGTAMTERALIDQPDYLAVEPAEEGNKLADGLARYWTEEIKWHWLPQNLNAPYTFSTMAQTSYIQGMSWWLKLRYVMRERVKLELAAQATQRDRFRGEPTTPEPALQIVAIPNSVVDGALIWDLIPTERVFFDHRNWKHEHGAEPKPLYWIHREFPDRAQVMALADLGEYDGEAIDRLKDTHISSDPLGYEEELDRRKNVSYETTKFRPRIMTDEHWGHIVDDNGDILAMDMLWSVGNQKEIILPPVPNPLYSRKIPAIAFGCIPVPGMPLYWRSLIESVSGLNRGINNIINMQLDSYASTIMGQVAVKPDFLLTPDDLEQHPLKTWLLKMNAPQDTIRWQQPGSAILDTIQILNLLDRMFQNGAFVNDFLTGSTSNPREVTATEVLEKGQQAAAAFSRIVGIQEREGFGRAVGLTYDFLLQYHIPGRTKRTAEVFGNAINRLDMMSDAERMAFLSGDFNFRFWGITAAIRQSQYLASLLRFLEILSGGAAALGANLPEIGREISKALHLNPDMVFSGQAPIQVQGQGEQGSPPKPPEAPGKTPGPMSLANTIGGQGPQGQGQPVAF